MHVLYFSMVQLNYICYALVQGSGTYGSRARCGSFDDCIWLSQIKLEFEKLQILVPPVT